MVSASVALKAGFVYLIALRLLPRHLPRIPLGVRGVSDVARLGRSDGARKMRWRDGIHAIRALVLLRLSGDRVGDREEMRAQSEEVSRHL